MYNQELINLLVQVMKVLLKHHGSSLTGVKSDLYTNIGMINLLSLEVPNTHELTSSTTI
jgi:hypothetical protein